MFVETLIKDTKDLESSLLPGDFTIDVKKCVNTVIGFSVDKILRRVM